MAECDLPTCPAQHVMDAVLGEMRGMRASLEHQADRVDAKLDLLREESAHTRDSLARHIDEARPMMRNYARVTAVMEVARAVAVHPWIIRVALFLVGAGSLAELAHALGWRP